MYEQIAHLQNGFVVIDKHLVKIKIFKEKFVKSKMKLLGHIVRPDGVTADPKNLKTIHDAPGPFVENLLHCFFATCGLLPGIHQNSSEILAVPYPSKSRTADFNWNDEMPKRFHRLNAKHTSTSALAFLDSAQQCIFKNEASSAAVGFVASQKIKNGNLYSVQLGIRTTYS